MPAFLWSGNQALDGTAAELFRVYVFTDRQCLNRVYTSAVVGSRRMRRGRAVRSSCRRIPPESRTPARATCRTAPRATTRCTTASRYASGTGPGRHADDGSAGRPGAAGTPTSTTPSTGSGTASSGSGSSSSSGSTLTAAYTPVDLWDTDWP